MKKTMALLLACLLLSGCAQKTAAEFTEATEKVQPAVTEERTPEIAWVSRFAEQTHITLTDGEITVEGDRESVFTSRDIIYYEDRDAYDSGNPYGEGEDNEKHSREEADGHTVVNITKPGAYVVTGKLSAGQIRVDLGEDAYEDENAVVELILRDADITCTVAPAILFLNTYECDGSWSKDDAKPDVDTSAAGANLILEGENTVIGSHVAKIFKDKDGEKKLWKQDGAIYSYMSMNVFGPGSLELTADNEGLDTELHLTINGGSISIRSDNDGINTNEDGVSVTTINAGSLHIAAGLGAEGDGIDSNGYLVIHGGTVVSAANPAGDAGLDSDMGSFIHGGTVIALGSTMDWAESNSRQATMNLQFARQQKAGSIVITREDGTVVFAYTPEEDGRSFSGAIISSHNLAQGETYLVYTGGTVTGEPGFAGIWDVTTVTAYEGGTQMQYTGTDVGMGGFGGGRPMGTEGMTPPEGFAGEMPGGFDRDRMPEDVTLAEGETMPQGGFGGRGQRPEGMEGMEPPEGLDSQPPEGEPSRMPEAGFGDRGQSIPGSAEVSTEFYLSDKVNAFSGVAAVQ